MTITETQKTAQLAADAAVSAAEAKQYMLEAEQGYQDTSAAAQQAQDAAGSALLSKQSAATSEENSLQYATEAGVARDEAVASASTAAEFGDNKLTFADTTSGIAGTTSGQYFRVPQGVGNVLAFRYYKNNAGVAVEVAEYVGQGSISNSVREYLSLTAAQSDVSAGNILNGGYCWVRDSADSTLANEYINNGGTLTATGRKMPSQQSIDALVAAAMDKSATGITGINAVNAVQIDNAANAVKHIFNTLQQVVSSAVTDAHLPQRSAFIINSMTNANAAGLAGGLTAKVNGAVTYQNAILPGESIGSSLKTSPYIYKDVTNLAPSGINFDATVVRVVFSFTIANQIVSTSGYNIQDKTSRFASTTQAAASGVSLLSVSSHSSGGLQMAIPNSVITNAGFDVTETGVKAYIASLGTLIFYCLTSVTQTTENFVDFSVVEGGRFSLEVAAGITFSAGLYSSRILPVEAGVDDLSRSVSFANFTRQIFAGDLSNASGLVVNDTAALFLTEMSTNGTLTNVNGITVSKDGTEIARRYLPGASTLSEGVLSSLYRPFRMRDLAVETLGTAATGMVRLRYFLPQGFGGLSYDFNTPVCVDISGLFYPATASNASTITQRAVSGHSENNRVQFMLTSAEITAAGYDPTDKYAVDRYLRTLAADCLFVAYTGVNQSFALDGSLLALSLPAGTYAFAYLSSCGLKAEIRKPPVVAPVDVGAYLRIVADVKNATSQDFSSCPVEIRTSLKSGEVPSSGCLVVIDSDGNEYPCQWADEFHCNNRQQSNMGFHADSSLKDGSVFIMDSIAAGVRKYYEIKAYNRVVRTYSVPQLVRNGRDFTVSVDGWAYTFTGSNQYQLRTIIDQAGTVHNVFTQLHITGIVSGSSSEVVFGYKPTLKLVSSGPVFTELETMVFNSAFAGIPAGALRGRIRTRLFKNGKVQVYTQVTAVSQIAVSLLYGVSTRCNMADAAYTYDNNLLTASWTDSGNSKNWSVSVVRANGDIHRDGTAYGPTRPVRATFLNPTDSSVRAYAGWIYDSSTDAQYSFANWPVKAGWTWTSEYWIDANNSLTDRTAIASQVQNRLVGHAGNCPFPAVSRQKVLSAVAEHVRGSMLWWNSADASPYGGGVSLTLAYHSYTADIMNFLAYGVGDFSVIYNNFKTYVAARWGSLATIGNAYTSGALVLQLASRLVIPVMQWLYYLAVKNGDTTKLNELRAGIKSLADALVNKFNALGGSGIPLNGTASDSGNSNSNATGMRAIALGIYAGQDTSGGYLTAYNALEGIITSRSGYMRIEGIITDAPSNVLASYMYLHYQVYATNNYLFAEKILNRTPVFDLVNFLLLSTGGMGGFREIDYCVSESRRGSANTISFSLFPLLLAESASASNAASALMDKFKSEYGPKPGFPLRFFGFDGTTSAGNTLSEISFVGTTLADIWLYYYFN
ncbi:hypothetical protein [Klebsiella michiganensis]|uniref:hypothetical protein n=1 Tax=Klebsiella michiganensis TaxID=1134687 RepID=UPI003132B846